MLYVIMLRPPILALNLTQDGSSGQDNGPERGELLDAAVVQYEPGPSANQRQGGAIWWPAKTVAAYRQDLLSLIRWGWSTLAGGP